MTFKLFIRGIPRTKKNHMNVATNAATGATFIAKDKKLQAWEKEARQQLQEQWKRAPIAGPVAVRAFVFRERNTGDLLNYLAAVHDILQQHTKKIKGERVTLWPGVIINDRQIVSVDGSRLFKDQYQPRIEIALEELEPQQSTEDPDGE